MNKPHFYLLSLILLAFLALPGVSRAAMSNDFMALRVPDLSQAVSFFQDVMNCETVAGANDRRSNGALLDCGDGTMLELSTSPPDAHASLHSSRLPAAVMTFSTPDAGSTMRWLRSHGITIATHPLTVRENAGLEKTIINFVAPWGQPMQLISYSKANDIPQLNDPDAVQLASP